MTPQTATEKPVKTVQLTVDGKPVEVREGATLLDAIRGQGVDTPTLCYIETLTPVNVCRVCVVELEGSRALVPSCSRRAEEGDESRSGHVGVSGVRSKFPVPILHPEPLERR